MFDEVCSVFGGNDATKKTQKTLLKQESENFSGSSNESIDSIFTRLHKIVTQLIVMGTEVEKEDLNLKFLRSLPSEFQTNVTVWENMTELETMKLNDLYNNFKIIEQRLKKAGKLGKTTGNLALVSSSVEDCSDDDCEDDVTTVETYVPTGNTKVTTVSSKNKKMVAGLGEPTFFAFISSQVK